MVLEESTVFWGWREQEIATGDFTSGLGWELTYTPKCITCHANNLCESTVACFFFFFFFFFWLGTLWGFRKAERRHLQDSQEWIWKGPPTPWVQYEDTPTPALEAVDSKGNTGGSLKLTSGHPLPVVPRATNTDLEAHCLFPSTEHKSLAWDRISQHPIT